MVDKILEWANLNEPLELWLLAFGLLVQTLFFGRWIVQWVASERRGESHVPVLFWWMSLLGASGLFVYFIFKKDLVGMLGNSIGWAVYIRNIILIRNATNGQRDRIV